MIILYALTGFLAGILGGMGMGGGTLLIPLLTLLFNCGQHSAQAMNLVSFIPMAIIALIIHLKNKYVKFDNILLIILPGLVSCFFGSYVAKAVGGALLKRLFGGFLIILSIIQFVLGLKNVKSASEEKE